MRKRKKACGLVWWNIHYFGRKQPVIDTSKLHAGIQENGIEILIHPCMERYMTQGTVEEYFDWGI